MRNVVLAVASWATVFSVAHGQSGAWADKMFRGQTSHDFGSVARGAQLYHKFPVTNIWAVPIEMVNIRTSCGCVTVTPSSKSLQPRETGEVEVMMDAHKFTGPKSVSIYITLGPQYTSTATLRVSANSRADVVFNPGEINFGIVQRGQTAQQTIEVEYAGVLDWRVQDVDKGNAPLDVAVEQMYRQPGRVGYRLKSTLKPDAPPGLLKHELFLRTNDPASPLVPVLVEANVQAPLTVKPNVVKLDGSRAGEAVTRRFNIYGTRPFRIVGIDGLGDGIQADIPPSPATVQIVTLKCQISQPGDIKRRLQVRTDLAGYSPMSVSVEGNILP